MNKKVRKTPNDVPQKFEDGKWIDITIEEFDKLKEDGYEEVDFHDDDKELDCFVEFADGRTLEHVYLKNDGTTLVLKFVDQEAESYDTESAELYFLWIEDSLKTNRTNFIEKVYRENLHVPEEVVEEDETSLYRYGFYIDNDIIPHLFSLKIEKDENVNKTKSRAEEYIKKENYKIMDVIPDVIETPDLSKYPLLNRIQEDEETPVEDTAEDLEIETTEETPVEDTLVFNTVGDLYNYVSNVNNKLDSTFIEVATKDLESTDEALGDDNFDVYEIIKPFEEEGRLGVRCILGVAKDKDGLFICFPENWATVKDVDQESIDIDEINKDISLQCITSEDLIIDDKDKFYDDLGNFYANGVAYTDVIADSDGTLSEPSSSEEPSEPENTDIITEPEPASITDIQGDVDTVESVSKVVKYRTTLSEEWLNKFSTENFEKKISAFEKKLTSYLRKNLRECISLVLGESEKFLVVRVDKSALQEKSLTNDWFKKRLNKICEAIKKYSNDLRIVETRGSYYTRSFFLVEALASNYCLSESDTMSEISIAPDKQMLESEEVQLNEKFIEYVQNHLSEMNSFIVKPAITNTKGENISYKVNNDNKIPYSIKVNESTGVMFVPSDILPILPQASVEEETQASAIANVVEPVVVVEPEPDLNTEKVYTREELFNLSPEDIHSLIACEALRECDNVGGFQVLYTTLPVKEGDFSGRVLVCDVYGDIVFVVPSFMVTGGCEFSIDPNVYAIVDLRGCPTYVGTGCERFLKNLAVTVLQ